jgi:transcriptional regulator SbtR-like protein
MSDRGFCECVGKDVFERAELEHSREEVRGLVGSLLRGAQDAGEVRRDVTVDDLTVILLGIARAAPPDGWPRYLEFALDGVKPR